VDSFALWHFQLHKQHCSNDRVAVCFTVVSNSITFADANATSVLNRGIGQKDGKGSSFHGKQQN